MDELGHAWAALGLKPGSTVSEVRKKYRSLAKRWHPDRHAQDPQGQAEAALQMKVLNSAYERLLVAAAATGDPATPSAARGTAASAPQRGRLSREELDRMVAAIGRESYVDAMLEGTPYARRARAFAHWTKISPGDQWEITGSVAAGLVFVAAALGLGVYESRVTSPIPGSRWYWLFAVPIVVAVVWRGSRRS